VKVGKVNVDENQTLAGTYSVMSIPTLIFFKDGKTEGQLVGYNSKASLVKKIESML